MTLKLTPPPYLRYAFTTLALATAVLLGLPWLLHYFSTDAGGFGPDKLNAFALAATLFWLALQLAFLAYRYLFPRFKTYQAECLEGEGKLFENLIDDLRKPLYPAADVVQNLDISQAHTLNIFTERRKVAQFQFLIRCVRLLFCLGVLFALLHVAQWAVTVGMGLLPGGLR